MSASAQHKRTESPGCINGDRLRSPARWILFLPLVAAGLFITLGCSVYMAANQPSKKDLTVLEQGTPRQAVTAELGTPIWPEDRNKETVEIYRFMQTSELFVATQPSPQMPTARVGTIGVVVRPHAPDALLRIPAKGWLANAGRGAANGASIGAIGLLCGYLAGACVTGLAVLGSIPGAIYGAVAAEPASSWEQAESAFQAALADLKIEDTIRDRVIENAQEQTPYHFTPLTDQEFTTAEIERSYPALDIKGIHTVLELSLVTVELRASDLAVNPFRKLVLTVWGRLIRTVDGAELDSRVITDEMGGIRSLAEWADQNDQVFRQEVTQAAQRLAQQVVKELFSDPHSPNDVQTPASQALSR